MIALVNLVLITTINIPKIYIDNKCDFDILRINKKDISCIDYGKYSTYCNHYSQPNEFVVYNEKGLNGKQITIKPSAMWEESDNSKYKIADFYYTFKCNKNDNTPTLIQHIVPTKKYDINPIYTILVFIIVLYLILYCCGSINYYDNSDNSDNSNYSNNSNNNDFWLGYLLASNNNSRKRTYCE